jgi:hypothetical protein
MNCCGDIINLCINQGATFAYVFQWLAPSCCPGTVGACLAPVDITGCTATLQIKPYALASASYYDASADIVLGGTAGTLYLTIPASATQGFTWWTGVYDLLITNSAGYATRLFSGTVTVSAAVSVAA